MRLRTSRRTSDAAPNTAAFAPKHLFNIWTMKHFYNGFGIGTGLRFIDKQFIDCDNEFTIDSAMTLNAMVYYQFSNLRLILNIDNITNTEYELRGFGATSVIPAKPRAVYSKIEFNI